ncbi:MAG: phosphoribosyltransferase [Bacteroidota bacterium]
MPYQINFDSKLTPISLNSIIKNDWEKSFIESDVIFNLKKIEWLSLEEITFLFGWFRQVKLNNKNLRNLRVELPTTTQSEPEIFPDEEIKKETIKRRRTRLISLWDNWKIYEKCGLLESQMNVTNDINKYVGKNDLEDNNWHKIIPFFAIPINDYENIDELRELIKIDVENKFNLQEHVLSILTLHTSNSAFENKSLSNIITTELFLNVIHHSFPKDFEGKKECYFAIALRNKISISKYISDKLRSGISLSEKEAIKRIEFIQEQNAIKERPTDERPFFQTKENGKTTYKNDSFIEFTFTDFGQGIPITLKEKYFEEINNPVQKEYLQKQLRPVHFLSKEEQEKQGINEDSLILEYAFLLHASRFPFEEQLKINQYVPRGLYFLVDIVKSYKGMVVVRSNKGKLVYDFSKNQDSPKDSLISKDLEKDTNYHGTLISIYLPAEKKAGDTKLNAIQRVLYHKDTKRKRENKYVSVIELQREAVHKFKYDNGFKEPDLFETYNAVFKAIDKTIDKLSESPCTLYFDFAGTDSSVVDHKLFYHLTNSPKINSNTSVVILNPPDKGVLLSVQQSIIASKDFICRPIPCIFSNTETIWIGIKNWEDEKSLNELLQYLESQNTKAISDFNDPISLLGNVIKIDWVDKARTYGNVGLSMLSHEELEDSELKLSITLPNKYFTNVEVPAQFIKEILEKNETNKVLLKDDNKVYWTSGGYYQNEFIRFIEKLYEINISSNEIESENDFWFGREVAAYLINKFEYITDKSLEFDYIVSVTLSSQLLANSVRDTYCKLKGIQNEKEKPTIVRLANYYEFTTEKAFKKIKTNKRVLIVNDVISTGKLNMDIYKNLVDSKSANVIGVFSIVDSRQPQFDEAKDLIKYEVEPHYKTEIDKKTIWLLRYPIDKFIANPRKKAVDIVSIDPVINTPNTMKYERSDISRITFTDSPNSRFKTKEFLDKIQNEENLWVGHLHHNVAHHSYFFKLHEWFRSDDGKKIIKFLVDEIRKNSNDLHHTNKNSSKNRTVITTIQDILKSNEFHFTESDSPVKAQYEKVLKELKSLSGKVEQLGLPVYNEKIDIIFYPMFSGAEVLTKADCRQIFGFEKPTDFILFPLGRVDTPKGWRFTFPPKILNEITKKFKNVFIIDDGTCTGDTLVQMIDSIAFLNVDRINVLSVVGRLDDFQREFFTRLDSIKIIHEREDDKSSKFPPNRIIPLSIYFGAHFHIQVYPISSDNCPFCEEIKSLEADAEKLLKYPLQPVTEFIEKRKSEIQIFETDGLRFEDYQEETDKKYEGLPDYLPMDIDKKLLFLYRDKIGKLATYRTFKEYLVDFENDNLEIWIAVILHEPKLLKTIEQLLPSLKGNLLEFIKEQFNLLKKNKIKPLNYRWKKSELIRFLILMEKNVLFNCECLKKVISREFQDPVTNDEHDYLVLIAHTFWKAIIILKKNKQEDVQLLAIESLEEFWRKYVAPLKNFTDNEIPSNFEIVFDKLIKWVNNKKDGNEHPFLKLKNVYTKLYTGFPKHLNDYKPFIKLYNYIDDINNAFNQPNTVKSSDSLEKIIELSKTAFDTFIDDIENSYLTSFEILKDSQKLKNFMSKNSPSNVRIDIIQKINSLTLDNIEITKNAIAEILNCLELFKTTFIFGKSDFTEYFINHGCCFISELEYYLAEKKEEPSFKNITIKTNFKDDARNRNINFHPEILKEKVIDEIFENIIKHSDRYKLKIKNNDFKTDVELSVELIDNGIRFKLLQNVPDTDHKGGGTDCFEETIKFFDGSFQRNSKINENYSIEFTLKLISNKLNLN